MNRKIRSESVLLQLTEEEQETLCDWILTDSFRGALVRLASPRPEGFEIKTHMTSLRRFMRRRQEEERQERIGEIPESAPADAKKKLLRAGEEAIADRAYELASLGLSPEEFGQAARCLEGIKRTELKEGYLRVAEEHLELARQQGKLDREKFEINTARLALEHAATLKEIGHDSTLDDEDKIRRAREMVFGTAAPK